MKTYLAPTTSIDSMILENCSILAGTGSESPAGYTGGGLPFGGAIQGNPSGDFFSTYPQVNEESSYQQYQWDNLSDDYMR